MSHRHALAALVAIVFAVGCGGPDPVNETHQGELAAGDQTHHQDNSFYDVYTFKAGEGYTMTVTMNSTAFDTFLHLNGPNGENWQYDDVAPGNTATSQIVQVAPSAGEYQVWANSLNAGQTGAYTVTIVTTKPN